MELSEPNMIYTIRVIYAGGVVQDFEATSFSIEPSKFGSRYSWTPAHAEGPRPIQLGSNHILAVWQLGAREAPAKTE